MGLARKLAGAESAALYRRAAGDFAVSAQTESYVVDSLYNEALCRMQLGKYAQAAEILDGLLEDGIYGSAACLAAAICRMHTGDFAAAKAGFDLCVAAGYEVGRSRLCRAVCLAGLGDLQAATADFNRNIGENVLASASYYGRGMLRLRQGDAEGGEADLFQAFQTGDGAVEISLL